MGNYDNRHSVAESGRGWMNKNPVCKKTISAAFNVNEQYIPYLGTLIQSIIGTVPSGISCDLCVLSTYLSVHSKKTIEDLASASNMSINFVDVSGLFEGDYYTGGKEGLFTKEAYFRLVIPFICSEYEKTLYLDCDMIVKSDISVLFDIDLENNLVASVPDYHSYGLYLSDKQKRKYWDNVLKLTNPEDYFCSGLVLFNNRKWNEEYSIDYILRLASSRKWRQHDQDVLNYLTKGHIYKLPLEWDVIRDYGATRFLDLQYRKKIAEAEKNPKIIHFTGSDKPWVLPVPRYEAFWNVAEKTPFFQIMLSSDTIQSQYRDVIMLEHCKGRIERAAFDTDIYYTIDGTRIAAASDLTVQWLIARFDDQRVRLIGAVSLGPLDEADKIDVSLDLDGLRIPCSRLGAIPVSLEYRTSKEPISIGFDVFVNKKDIVGKHIRVVTVRDGTEVLSKRYTYGGHFIIDDVLKDNYHIHDGLCFCIDDSVLFVKDSRDAQIIRKEIHLGKQIVKQYGLSFFIFRQLINILSRLRLKRIWLISDRPNKAGDNGEAFLDYVLSEHKEIKPIFVLNKDSEDYGRIKGKCAVISINTKLFWLLFLVAEFNISSHADFLFSYFGRFACVVRSSKKNNYVFLQHGTIKDDISETFNIFNQDMAMFVTTAIPEYHSLIQIPEYGLDETIVKLTGQPRHDKLYNVPERIVCIMPTWRLDLFEVLDKPNIWTARPGFEETEYFKFYNNLINDAGLIGELKKRNYKL